MSNPIEIREFSGIQVVRAGKEGPNILFLHDSGQPPVGMERQIRQLSEAGQVYAPNLFDLAASLRRRKIDPSFPDMVHKFKQLDLLDKHQKTGIVAVSVGTGFAFEHASQNPQEVEWITAGSALGYPLHRSLFRWVVEFIRLTQQTSTISSEIRKKDAGTALLKNQFRKNPKSVLDIFGMAMNMDSRDVMQSLQTPVDLLWASNDNFTPLWSGRKMEKLLPHAKLEEVSDYFHYWYQFEPEKLTNPAVLRAKNILS